LKYEIEIRIGTSKRPLEKTRYKKAVRAMNMMSKHFQNLLNSVASSFKNSDRVGVERIDAHRVANPIVNAAQFMPAATLFGFRSYGDDLLERCEYRRARHHADEGSYLH
jgi:hypothetical protein